MTTLTETQWEEPYLAEPFDDSSSSPEFDLETEIGGILAEPLEEFLNASHSLAQPPCSLFPLLPTTGETQQHFASALGSALHETLAKYSVKDIPIASKNIEESDNRYKTSQSTIVHHLTEISEFWDGWFDDIAIDEEINSDLDTHEPRKHNEDINRTEKRSTNVKRNTSRLRSNDPKTGNNDVVLTISPIPAACVLTPLIIDVTSKSKSEVTSLFLKSQVKKPERISSGSSSDECESLHKSRKHATKRNTKTKKRKLNVASTELFGEKKTKLQTKKISKNLHDFSEVFKVEQVLKIKAVDQDCEDEEIDIGDLTDTIPN